MINILFFASIRERLGLSCLSIALPDENQRLGTVIQHLIAQSDPQWSEVLLAGNVVKAVNQRVVDDDFILTDGDELAFFPPVTGG
jgi:molybdopterin synthase sulfur carrier subunit